MDILKAALPSVLILIILAVTLGVGSQVILKTQETQLVQATNQQANDSVNVSQNAFATLSYRMIINTTVTVYNSSAGVILQAANWTMTKADSEAGQINISGASFAGKILNVSYSYVNTTYTTAYNSSQDGLVGLDTFSDFQPTLAVILVAVVVIGALLGGWAMMNGFNLKGGF